MFLQAFCRNTSNFSLVYCLWLHIFVTAFYLPDDPAQVGRTFYATCRCRRSLFAWLLWGITSYYWKCLCGYQSLNTSFASCVCVCVRYTVIYGLEHNVEYLIPKKGSSWFLICYFSVVAFLNSPTISYLGIFLVFSPINMLISYARSLKNPWTLVL